MLIYNYLKDYYTVKKIYFQDLLSQNIFFCQINFRIILFLMIKLISLIVLTHFFQFNQLKKVSNLGCLKILS